MVECVAVWFVELREADDSIFQPTGSELVCGGVNDCCEQGPVQVCT